MFEEGGAVNLSKISALRAQDYGLLRNYIKTQENIRNIIFHYGSKGGIEEWSAG